MRGTGVDRRRATKMFRLKFLFARYHFYAVATDHSEYILPHFWGRVISSSFFLFWVPSRWPAPNSRNSLWMARSPSFPHPIHLQKKKNVKQNFVFQHGICQFYDRPQRWTNQSPKFMGAMCITSYPKIKWSKKKSHPMFDRYPEQCSLSLLIYHRSICMSSTVRNIINFITHHEETSGRAPRFALFNFTCVSVYISMST